MPCMTPGVHLCLNCWLLPEASLQLVATLGCALNPNSHCQVADLISGVQGRGGGGVRVAKENRVHRPGVDDDELEVVPARHGRRGQRDAEGG